MKNAYPEKLPLNSNLYSSSGYDSIADFVWGIFVFKQSRYGHLNTGFLILIHRYMYLYMYNSTSKFAFSILLSELF